MSVKVREKPKGSDNWYVVLYKHGKEKAKRMPSKAEANKFAKVLALQEASAEFGIEQSAPRQVSFGHYAQNWLELYIKPPMRAKRTHERYSHIVNNHIDKKFSNTPIDRIKRAHVRDTLLKYYRAGYAKKSVELMHTVISSVFTQAMDDELVSSNPAVKIMGRLGLANDSKEISPLTKTEMDLVLNILKEKHPNDYYPIIFFMFRTGTRLGEACGICWDDINFRAQTAKICRSAKDQVIKNKLKTESSYRTIDISDQLLAMLIEHKKRHRARVIKSKESLASAIFQKNGRLIPQNSLRRVFDKTLEVAGLDHRRLHDIRHTYASILLSENVSPVYVKGQLGHSSITMTIDIYGHWIPNGEKTAVNILDNSTPKYSEIKQENTGV